MDLLLAVFDGDLLGQQDYSSFRGAVRGCGGRIVLSRNGLATGYACLLTSARLQADHTEHACGVDDPPSVLVGAGLLFEELPDGVLAAEEDAAAVDVPARLTCQSSVGVYGARHYGARVATYMTKSHVSSFISWTLPALSVPPVPALLTMLEASEGQPERYLIVQGYHCQCWSSTGSKPLTSCPH